jgi:ribosome-dependent ATPase
MKMLTGLLPASEGEAWLFGRPVDAKDIDVRKRVGYMSQSFSLYTELSVRQNLELHARLFHLPARSIPARLKEMVERFDLAPYIDQLPESLPLGIRQRLSLAVAVIHEPEMLILDEPTSGVDPAARDDFWELLVDLSRRRGVTIFISTHFMNEAERCDRISLMHAGKVLAQGAPRELVRLRQADTLENAFISYIQEASSQSPAPETTVAAPPAAVKSAAAPDDRPVAFSVRRFWAYARREAMEILRDPIRLAFAFLGPMVLMITFGYGISFDVENLSYAVLDLDQSPESRAFLENFSGSRYFREEPPIADHEQLERRLESGKLKVAVEIPAGFGKDLLRGRRPEAGVWLDGAMPFRAQTSLGYVEGIYVQYLQRLKEQSSQPLTDDAPADVQVRFRYNQAFKSVYAMVPGVLMLLLMMIPAMMTAVGVVREKEMGTITNLYATPVTGLEFLLGKQLPYVAIAYANFLSLLFLAVFLFQTPVKGSSLALAGGAALYVVATTGFGLLVSTFVKTQVAAIFAASILSMLPAVQFSGLFTPIASLSGGAKAMGRIFPTTYFQQISVGCFTKALGFEDLAASFLALAAFVLVCLAASLRLLKKQEA